MIEVITLKNGARMILEKTDSVESVAVGIYVRVGSKNEKDGIRGISHVTEHMLFKGTEKRTAKQIASDFDSLGASSNASTGKEMTSYYFKSIKENFEPACEILLDFFCNSTFNPEEMEKEKTVIFEEIKMHEDQAASVCSDAFDEIIYNGTALEHPIIGYQEDIENMKPDDLRSFMKEHYFADNIVVSIVGNFDKELAIDLFEKGLENIPKRKRDNTFKKGDYVKKVNSIKKDMKQCTFIIGCPAVRYNHELHDSCVIFNIIFGSGMSSRLFQKIREKEGLAYSVSSSFSAFEDAGDFGIFAGVSEDTIGKTISAIRNEIKLLKDENVTEEELKSAKVQMKSIYIFGLESVFTRMKINAGNLLLRDEILYPADVIKRIENVTRDGISNVIDLIGDFSNYSAVSVSENNIDLETLMK